MKRRELELFSIFNPFLACFFGFRSTSTAQLKYFPLKKNAAELLLHPPTSRRKKKEMKAIVPTKVFERTLIPPQWLGDKGTAEKKKQSESCRVCFVSLPNESPWVAFESRKWSRWKLTQKHSFLVTIWAFPSTLLSTLRSLKITGGRDSANKKKKIFRVVFHFTNFHFNCSQSRPSPSFVFHFFICSLRASSKMLRVKSASSFVIHIGGLMRKTFFSFLLCSSHANVNF